MTRPADNDRALISLFASATTYYASARFAVLSSLFPAAATLLHHSIELYLKGILSMQSTDNSPRVDTTEPNLFILWKEGKSALPRADLVRFDATVSALH